MNILLPCGHESEFTKPDCLPCQKYNTDDKFRALCEKLNTDRLKAQTPTLIQKVVTATEAAVKYVKAGMPEFLMEELSKERLKVCEKCTENKDGECVAINSATGKACGCFISLKTKTPTEDCPLGKWPRINLNVIKGKCGGCGNK